MTIRVRSLTDKQERHAAIPALSDLRIRIFRGWPYLYDGTADYEAAYLAEFISEPNAVLVVATDDDVVVGAATASPMAGQKPDFQLPVPAYGLEVARIFYFGESVLLPEYQGQGIGHQFFDAREAAARAAGASGLYRTGEPPADRCAAMRSARPPAVRAAPAVAGAARDAPARQPAV